MDEEVKAILSDLYHAINDRLESSARITENVRKLEELGYGFSIYLEASILLTREDDDGPQPARKKTKRKTRRIHSGSLKLDERDVSYLKSLKIAVDKKE